MRITINTNPQEVEEIRAAIKANDGYCPCALEKIPDTRCMCKDFITKEEIGWCHCGLYFKEEV